MLTPDELAALDDFRFKTRMPSRASAVRELLRRGLAAEGFLTADLGSKSGDFGVIGNGSAVRSRAGYLQRARPLSLPPERSAKPRCVGTGGPFNLSLTI